MTYDTAMEQWDKYVDVLKRHSTTVVTLPDEPDCPDSHFVEDTAVLFRDEVAGEEVAVVCSNMAEPRRPEVASMLKQLVGEKKQYERIEHIDGDGEVRTQMSLILQKYKLSNSLLFCSFLKGEMC